jgi:CheY-like chemotaxis protein
VERSTIRVLVVDDYEPWRHSMLSMLQQHPGLRVVSEVADGLEAVRKVQEFEVDLILLDIGLPTLNGIAAAKEIRKLCPEGYLVKADAGRELRTAVNAVLRGQRFVGRRFLGQGFPEASDARVTKSMGNQNVSALLEQSRQVAHCHKVMFYSEDRHYLDDLAQFIERALRAGNAAIVVANESHRNSLCRRFEAASGVDIAAATDQGRYIALDAAETVSSFMVDGMPDRVRLLKGFGNLLQAAAKAAEGDQPRVVACGQIAPILWSQGNAEAAIQVEKLTNHLVDTYGVDILCGYPEASFQGDLARKVFEQICAEHSAVDSR